MPTVNKVSSYIKSLEDLIPLSRYVEPSIHIVREIMKFDPSHDEQHLVRVARDAIWFGVRKSVDGSSFDHIADLDILLPAAILHDLVNYPKDHPNRSKASYESAKLAIEKLEDILPFKSDMHHVCIFNAIESHSFSAGVKPTSLEGYALQDADRIEALGYIGLARLFTVGGSLKRQIWHPTDPLAKDRELDELAYTLDHVSVKLGKLHSTMKTEIGKKVAIERTGTMIEFIYRLMLELDPSLDRDQLHDELHGFVLRDKS